MTPLSSQLLARGDDTIAAVATARGRSATALIRVSGARAFEIVGAITGADPLPPPRRVVLRVFRSARDGAPLDRGLLSLFCAPASYTGEDLAELSVHGGVVIQATLMEALVLAGARQALPGEFTRRALLNGKLDLLQAEAVGDLVDARSRRGVSAALRQLDGGLTRRINELREAVLEAEALVAYEIDFPEEDDGPVNPGRVISCCETIIQQLGSLHATATVGELLREGVPVVIAGVPNAGKSSLFNALLGERRSLVTEVPGTTRDAIEAVVDSGRWPLRLIDTAGLRDASEHVERLGIEVAESRIAEAAVILVCGESFGDVMEGVARARSLSTAPIVVAVTKRDLNGQDGAFTRCVEQLVEVSGTSVVSAHEVSAVTGNGLSDLLQGIELAVDQSDLAVEEDSPLLLRARHARAVAEAMSEVGLFMRAFRSNELPLAIACTHLRAGVDALESLVGVVEVEDVLGRVFSSFCVGK